MEKPRLHGSGVERDMDSFSDYSHALAAMSGFSILMIVLGAMSTVGRSSENRGECGTVKRDYNDVVYRRGRAFANAMEIVGPFLGATLAAILVGASPFWVNLFASIFLVARIAMAAVHIGTTNQPMRSAFWALGTVCVMALAISAIIGAF
ncbi:MAG: MAPEG family protein [Aliishimia sp.]